MFSLKIEFNKKESREGSYGNINFEDYKIKILLFDL